MEAARIPLVAVTGTNGKTTTTRLIAHMAKHAGFKPGYNTTEGIYIDGHLIRKGDCTGYLSAQEILFDPSIDFAVLETARGGIIRNGLGWDYCDVSVITNITEDHLGLMDIETLDDLVKVKSLIAKNTRPTGYAVLNAEDDKVYGIIEELDCNIAFFAIDPNNERILKHVKNNGLVAVCENEYVIVYRDGYKIVIDKIKNIPLSFDGRAEFMVKNVLAAVLVAVIEGFSASVIKEALKTFIPNPQLTPGRMNIFDFKQFTVIVDYAHNMDSFSQMKKFLDKTEATSKTGVICVPGDRKADDIRLVGQLSAKMFDTIIIKHDEDLRGRTREEITELLVGGIREVNETLPVSVISEEKQAIDRAIAQAQKGSLIFVCTATPGETINYISGIQKENMPV